MKIPKVPKIGSVQGAYSQIVDALSTLNWADAEIAGGGALAWTLANTPNPTKSLRIFNKATGLMIFDFTLTGSSFTTVANYTAGNLIAWYRY